MKSSTGVVMQLEKKHAFIMTSTGEFLKVMLDGRAPNIGEVYSGKLAKTIPFYKYTAVAASMLFVLLSGGISYAYYTPTASIEVNINPSIELKVNRWDKILKSVPLNSDGEKVLSTLNIKNKTLNDGLDLIIEEAKKDNFINESYIESGKVITVSVKDNKLDKKLDLSKFEAYAKKNNLNIKINSIEEEKKNNDASQKSVPNNKDDDSTKLDDKQDSNQDKGKNPSTENSSKDSRKNENSNIKNNPQTNKEENSSNKSQNTTNSGDMKKNELKESKPIEKNKVKK
jgi:hypothetical protein